MAQLADEEIDEITADALAGPAVAAGPDYFVMDATGRGREPVLAWRVGAKLVLPVTRRGAHHDVYVVHNPDVIIRWHGTRPAPELPGWNGRTKA